MPAPKYKDLVRALKKGEIPPALYLYGTEEILKDEAVQLVVDHKLAASDRELNYEQRTVADLDPESLNTLLETLPMFGGNRVVVLRAIEGLKKKPKLREVLLAALRRKHDDTWLVLIQTAPKEEGTPKEKEPDAELAKLTLAIAADRFDPQDTVRWLQYRAGPIGIRFAEGAAEHLAKAVDYDLSTLRSELEKFSALGGELAITVQQVGDIVGIHQGQTVLDWRTAIMRDETALALKLLGPILLKSGNSGVKLVSMLGTGLVALSVARARFDQGERGAALVSALMSLIRTARLYGVIGNWNDEARLWAELAPRWPRPRLRAALRAALAADQALKETRISDEQGVVTDLVLTLAGHLVEGGRTTAGV